LFITGFKSFIGTELIKHCAVRGIECSGCDTAGDGVGYVKADVRSSEVAEAIPEGCDALVHLAAISRDQDCRKDPYLAFDVNVQGTLNLIRAARARRVGQFLFASSEWVYGNSGPALVTEASVIDIGSVVSEYALTKLVGERALAMACQRDFCPATVLRFGIVYGPRPVPSSAVESIFRDLRTRGEVELKSSPQSGRRYVHVSDLAEGILSALGRRGFEIFNLTGDTLITFADVIRQGGALLGIEPRVVISPPETLQVRNPDNRKARAELRWEPRIDLAAGLESLLP
jgi:nucleoside-diphosphate-sugar epimerase